LVGPSVIEPDTHCEDPGAPICTDWSVIAALMRWFHDKPDIDYHQMALGEASTSSLIPEDIFSRKTERPSPRKRFLKDDVEISMVVGGSILFAAICHGTILLPIPMIP